MVLHQKKQRQRLHSKTHLLAFIRTVHAHTHASRRLNTYRARRKLRVKIKWYFKASQRNHETRKMMYH